MSNEQKITAETLVSLKEGEKIFIRSSMTALEVTVKKDEKIVSIHISKRVLSLSLVPNTLFWTHVRDMIIRLRELDD